MNCFIIHFDITRVSVKESKYFHLNKIIMHCIIPSVLYRYSYSKDKDVETLFPKSFWKPIQAATSCLCVYRKSKILSYSTHSSKASKTICFMSSNNTQTKQFKVYEISSITRHFSFNCINYIIKMPLLSLGLMWISLCVPFP